MTVSNTGITQVFTAPTCATVLETKNKTKFGANPTVCYVRRNIGNKGANSFIIFFNKLPAGATLVSATLTLTAASNWGPAFNMTVFELRERWGAANVTWAKQPGSTGTSTTKNVPANITKGTKVDFNVTPQYASYLTNPKSYGMKIYTGSPDNTTYRNFYGSGTNRPKLTVVYTLPIDKPTDLSPGSDDLDESVYTTSPKPTFSAVFDSNTTTAVINQVQVQITTNFTGKTPSFITPLWDSGWVTTSTPELDSSTRSGSPTLTVGTKYGWRIRFKSNQGVESPWSDGVILERAPNPVVAISKQGLTADYGNLATNPSFEIVADYTQVFDMVLMRNAATNPSFELTNNTDISIPGGGSAKDVLRQKGGGPVTGVGGAAVYRDPLSNSLITSRWPLDGLYSLCVDAGTSSSNTSSAVLSGSASGTPTLWNVSSGGTYTVSAYFYQDTLQTGTLSAFARSIKINITAPSVNGGAPMAGWKVAQAQNIIGMQRVSVTFTIPENTTAFDIELTNGATSGKVWWDALLIDTNKKLNRWFDKNTILSSNAGGVDYLDYRVADLGDSGSAVYVKGVRRYGGPGKVHPSTGIVYRVTSHPSMSSAYCLAMDPAGAANADTYASLITPGYANSLEAIGMVKGKTYTVSADIYLSEAQTGTLWEDARKIVLRFETPSGIIQQASNQGEPYGLSRVSVTATVPSNATGVAILLYNGANDYDPVTETGGQIVLWDNVRISLVPDSSYVDGNTLGYSWSGTNNLSTTEVNSVVLNSTPTFVWGVTGGSQAFREAMVLDMSMPDSNNIIWTSGRQDTEDLDIGIPEGVITEINKPYRFVVRVEDGFKREPTYSGGTYYSEYVEDSVDFIYMLDDSVSGVESVTTVMNNPIHVELLWTTNNEPDFFEVSRNGVVIKTNMIPDDYKIGDRSYRFFDRTTQTNTVNVWEIRCIFDGRTSGNNKQVTRKVSTTLLWLYTGPVGVQGGDIKKKLPDNPNIVSSTGAPIYTDHNAVFFPTLIPIAGESPADFKLYEKGETFEPLNSSNPVRITEALGGYRGKVSGVLCGECLKDGTTSQDLQNTLLNVRDNVGSSYILHLDNITIPVIVYNINTYPLYGSRFGKSYGVEFEFFEVVD